MGELTQFEQAIQKKYTALERLETLRKIRFYVEHEGLAFGEACKKAKIPISTVLLWKRRYRSVADYISLLQSSQAIKVEDSLYKKAVKGNVQAQIFYLKNRGEGWRDTPLVDQSMKVIKLVWKVRGSVEDIDEREGIEIVRDSGFEPSSRSERSISEPEEVQSD